MSIYQMCYRGIQRNEQAPAEEQMRDIEIHFQSMSNNKVPYRDICKFFIKKYLDAVNANRAMYYRLQKLDPSLKVSSSFSSDIAVLQDVNEPKQPRKVSKMEERYAAMRNGTIKPRQHKGSMDVTTIKAMRTQGVSVEDIADKFGVSVATVYRRLKE